MRMHFDSNIGAHYRTELTPNASRGIMNLGIVITPDRNVFGHRDDLLGTYLGAQFASFAVVLIYSYTWH